MMSDRFKDELSVSTDVLERLSGSSRQIRRHPQMRSVTRCKRPIGFRLNHPRVLNYEIAPGKGTDFVRDFTEYMMSDNNSSSGEQSRQILHETRVSALSSYGRVHGRMMAQLLLKPSINAPGLARSLDVICRMMLVLPHASY